MNSPILLDPYPALRGPASPSAHTSGGYANTPSRAARTKHRNKTPGAFGGQPKKAAKEAFLRQSNEAANEIGNQRALKRAYREWRESMSPEELARARQLKVHFPADPGTGAPLGSQEDTEVDFHDPADLPEASVSHLPVDDLEPQNLFSKAIDALGSEEVAAAADCFGQALTWALDVPNQNDLVQIGSRAMVLIGMLRPDLDVPERLLRDDLVLAFDKNVGDDWLATGDIFGRILEWVRRGDAISAIGERLCLVAYVVRPAMIDSPTLARLGATMNKTRQAKDKLVQCLRDTFSGLKAAAMRGENTRLACQNAH